MLEVSTRTIYRDLRDLSLSGVPVRGGPGEGYQLDPGYFLPPITFTADELEALRLGATMVARTTDDDLAAAARLALDRIDATVPPSRRLAPENLHFMPVDTVSASARQRMSLLRRAIREQRRVRINYTAESDERTNRIIWPVGLFFWGKVWTVTAWCELRDDFRDFRLDRIQELTVQTERFELDDDLVARHLAGPPA